MPACHCGGDCPTWFKCNMFQNKTECPYIKEFKLRGEKMTLQDLLKMKVKIGDHDNCTPEFRLSVLSHDDGGSTHIIVHADGHDSGTLDFLVTGNTLETWEA